MQTMFDLSCVGIANATSAGWGNLGGGVAQLINSSIFKGMKNGGLSNDSAWRASLAWSPCVLVILGISIYLFTDDCPYGNFTGDPEICFGVYANPAEPFYSMQIWGRRTLETEPTRTRTRHLQPAVASLVRSQQNRSSTQARTGRPGCSSRATCFPLALSSS